MERDSYKLHDVQLLETFFSLNYRFRNGLDYHCLYYRTDISFLCCNLIVAETHSVND